MKVGDLVRTKVKQAAFGYNRPPCIAVASRVRIDGLIFEIIDAEGVIRSWFEEDLEVISESR